MDLQTLESPSIARKFLKKEDRELAEVTAHFIQCGRDTTATGFNFFDHLCKITEEKWKTEHTPFAGFRPHRKAEH